MTAKVCVRCNAAFHGHGGARYCSPQCKEHARRSREKTQSLRQLREMGEQIHAAKARIKAGDGMVRSSLRAELAKDGIDLDEELPYNEDVADELILADTSELLIYENFDEWRHIQESK